MKRVLIYLILGVTALLVIWMFVTARTYTQLGVAVVLYPILAFLIIKALPRKTQNMIKDTGSSVLGIQPGEGKEVVDIDKRTFLKLVGATGIFFFISSLLGKWLGTLPFSQGAPPLSHGASDASSDNNGSPLTNGYTITEIDEGIVSYYGFTDKDGAWMIMKEDSDTSSFRYAKGDVNFPKNWGNRANLNYDYYYNLK